MCYDGCPYFRPYSERCARGRNPCPNDEDYKSKADVAEFAKEMAEEQRRERMMERANAEMEAAQ